MHQPFQMDRAIRAEGLHAVQVVSPEIVWLGCRDQTFSRVAAQLARDSHPVDDLVVVLGCQPRDGVSAERAKRAQQILSRLPQAYVLLSGANTQSVESINMAGSLVRGGIAAHRLILDGVSRRTFENIAYAGPVFAATRPTRVHVVTHGYHMPRVFALMSGFVQQLRDDAKRFGLDPRVFPREVCRVEVETPHGRVQVHGARERRVLKAPPCAGLSPQACDERLLRTYTVGPRYDALVRSRPCPCGVCDASRQE